MSKKIVFSSVSWWKIYAVIWWVFLTTSFAESSLKFICSWGLYRFTFLPAKQSKKHSWTSWRSLWSGSKCNLVFFLQNHINCIFMENTIWSISLQIWCVNNLHTFLKLQIFCYIFRLDMDQGKRQKSVRKPFSCRASNQLWALSFKPVWLVPSSPNWPGPRSEFKPCKILLVLPHL